MQERDEVKPVRRVLVDDEQKKGRRELEKVLRAKLSSKVVVAMNQSELVELVLLLASQAGLVDGQGRVI